MLSVWCVLSSAVVGVVAVVCGLWLAVHAPTHQHGPEYVDYPWVVAAVQRVEWDPRLPFAEAVAERGEPVILYHTVVDNWRARHLWNESYFVEHTPIFTGVQKHSSKTFSYFHADHPFSSEVVR